MELAILVGLKPLGELRTLAAAAGARTVKEIVQRREKPDSAFFVGQGKVSELREEILARNAETVIFDGELSTRQVRNLERTLEVKVIDRTSLILDIFASRAQSREGKLQVELAQLNHRLSRLAGRTGSLSRLGGGIGTRGPGETQLEVDRRRIRQRIAKLKKEIEQVRKHRQLHRDRRKRSHFPLVSLVGYTNAGKSTLFSKLSGKSTLVSEKVFATLDTLVRSIHLGSSSVLLSDTVGFIRDLPHELVTSFRATLEEILTADLILHVVDVSDPDHEDKIHSVVEVLRDIGAGEHPRLIVYSKADLTDVVPATSSDEVIISAKTGVGIDELRNLISELISSNHP